MDLVVVLAPAAVPPGEDGLLVVVEDAAGPLEAALLDVAGALAGGDLGSAGVVPGARAGRLGVHPDFLILRDNTRIRQLERRWVDMRSNTLNRLWTGAVTNLWMIGNIVEILQLQSLM